jgi:phosphotransferase system HPr-like phosphotransfer protein
MLLLVCPRGSRVTVRASGPDAQTAVDAVRALFVDRFGEGT